MIFFFKLIIFKDARIQTMLRHQKTTKLVYMGYFFCLTSNTKMGNIQQELQTRDFRRINYKQTKTADKVQRLLKFDLII